MPPLKFLSDEDLKAMHEATLQVLNEVGVVWTHKPSLDILTDAGCTVKDNRVYFPPDLVMDSIAKAKQDYTQSDGVKPYSGLESHVMYFSVGYNISWDKE